MSKDIIDIDIINEEKPKGKRGRKPKDKSNEVALTKDEKKKKSTSKKKDDDEMIQKDSDKTKKKTKKELSGDKYRYDGRFCAFCDILWSGQFDITPFYRARGRQ